MSKTLKNMRQTHGRADSDTPTTLDQIFGDTGMSTYGTLDEEEYSQKLEEMSTHDLHEHAISRGIVAMDNKQRLLKTLKEEFHKHVMSFKVPARRSKGVTQPSKELLAILAEGK